MNTTWFSINNESLYIFHESLNKHISLVQVNGIEKFSRNTEEMDSELMSNDDDIDRHQRWL